MDLGKFRMEVKEKQNNKKIIRRKDKNEERLFAVLTIVLLTIMLAGCQTPSPVKIEDEKETEAVDIRIGGLKGPTSMGMVRLMELAEAGEVANNYTFTISGSADEVTPKLIKGELDMAAQYLQTLLLFCIIIRMGKSSFWPLILWVLTILLIKGDEVQSFADLKGKTIYGTGKGSIPEYILRYLLSANGIDPDKDVKLEWKSEPTEIVALFSKLEKGIALMPQPYVTVAQTQIEGLRIALDLTKEWRALSNDSTLITGVLVVRKDFAEKYPEQIATFLDEYQQSTEYVNAHIPEAAKLVEKYGIVKAAVAEKAIPYCNIYYMDGTEMKTAMQGYLKSTL